MTDLLETQGIFKMNVELNMVGRAVAGTLLAVALSTGTASAEEIERTLYAGQTLPVGTVTITTGTPGQVDFVIDDSNSFCLTEIHVAVGAIGTGIPVNKQGSPKIGRFPYQDYPACEKSSGFQIAEGIAEGDNVAAHAKLQYADATKTESAWAAGYRFTTSKDWSTYVTIAQPLPPNHVFARAYIDLDGNGEWSPDSLNDPDSLIAELVDDNNSGFIDVGDKVYTNQYPIDLDASQRADFGINEHTVASVLDVINKPNGKVIRVAVTGGVIVFGYASGEDIDEDNRAFEFESYSESVTNSIATETLLVADGIGDQSDSLKAVQGKGPSQPEEPVAFTSRVNGTDDPFINIDFDLP